MFLFIPPQNTDTDSQPDPIPDLPREETIIPLQTAGFSTWDPDFQHDSLRIRTGLKNIINNPVQAENMQGLLTRRATQNKFPSKFVTKIIHLHFFL